MSLDNFNTASRIWFRQTLGEPSPAQAQAWPLIRQGRNTLISAPTGSGKTLAAFYAVIDELLSKGLLGELGDATQVVYVSPLKALSNDIQRNLEQPLRGIEEQLHLLSLPPVSIRVAVRTGDTPQNERQKMLKKPPHILVTTPESLYLMLSSRGGRQMLKTAGTLIVDEIHALLGDKRGAHLSLSMERLERLSGGPLRRIGLSATQKPIARVAEFLVGGGRGESDCAVVDTGHRRDLDISLEVPESPLTGLMSNDVWGEIHVRLLSLVQSHDTTLIFVNTRRLAERLALTLAEHLGPEAVSSHHGSMSKDHRHRAEQKFKQGQLKVLVATASMELGIDVGSVNLVVQIASPKGIAAFLQRVGRSGHSMGGRPKGILFPLSRDDLVECTALIDSIKRGELDAIVMPERPLDILAQQIVAEVASLEEGAEEAWDLDDLFALCRRAYPYRDLSEQEFSALLEMLAEGYSTRRGRSGAYLHLDRINGRLRPRKNARLTALTNGGAIPDMFDYQVVLDPEDIVVGSLNEDFALESLPGDIFTLGTHSWRLLRVDGLKVRVCDAQGQPPTVPFWLGEGGSRSRELSQAVSRLRCDVEQLLDKSESDAISAICAMGLSPAAAEQLVHYLKAGRDALGAMPSRDCLIMERFFDEVGDMHIVIHAPFGSRVNKAWGLALRKRFCRSFNFELQAAANEDSIVISLGSVHSFPLAEVFSYLNTASLREVLIQALLVSPMFEVRWRWNASRALAVQRMRGGKRVPPQFQRMQAEDLVAQVFPDQIACQENLEGDREVPDHPLVRQTVNDCLHEAMDIDELMQIIGKIEAGELSLVAKDLREPSAFSQEIINARPYAFLDDAPFEERRTNAIRHRSWVDPAESSDFSALDAEAIARVREEAWPSLRSGEELHDALLSLGFISKAELAAEENALLVADWCRQLLEQGRICALRFMDNEFWVAMERLPQFLALGQMTFLSGEIVMPDFLSQQSWQKEEALREIIRGRLEGLGPVSIAELASPLGLPGADVELALLALETEGFVFRGRFTPLSDDQGKAIEEWCERRLLQRIHRYTIESHRQSISPVSLQTYMLFLFDLHGIQPQVEGRSGPASLGDQQALLKVLQRLDGFSAPAAAWEADILPARVSNYDPAWLDFLCVSGRINWGRLSRPTSALNESGQVVQKRTGPVKSTPIHLVQRENLSLWQGLHGRNPEPDVEDSALSGTAQTILADLLRHGASFAEDIARRTAYLRTQIEEALAELVARGKVSSDSFTGLRALLTPNSRKPRVHGRGSQRRAVFGIEDAGRWFTLTESKEADKAFELADEELGRLINLYLERWGVIARSVLEKEAQSPPWRLLLRHLRRMELRGELRGGRFINGIGGEQFALPGSVDKLRRIHKENSDKSRLGADYRPSRVVLGAADPLNLLGTVLPEKKLANIPTNRVLFEDGVPVAVLEKNQVKFLREVDAGMEWMFEQALQRRSFPPRLRAYLGKSYR